MKIPKILIAAIFGLLIFLRVVFEGNSDLVLLVTVFNIVAALIVLLDIAAGIREAIIQKIKETCAVQTISIREQRKFKKIFGCSLVVGVILFIGFTLMFCRSNLGNDVLSMASLGLSLIMDEIVRLGKNLYRI